MEDLKNGSIGKNIISNVNPNDGAHKGRGGFTKKAEDMYKFKVPQLYNLKDSPFYGHGASFSSIREVVEYKNNGIKENMNVADEQLSPEFKPLNLSEEEISQITIFLENALRDPELHRYVPKSLPSGLGFPNNDQQSRIDLGF
jgi:cytochrome c peroxidase